jgi:hypothetical protein
MGNRDRVGIGLSYRPDRLQIHSLAELVKGVSLKQRLDRDWPQGGFSSLFQTVSILLALFKYLFYLYIYELRDVLCDR